MSELRPIKYWMNSIVETKPILNNRIFLNERSFAHKIGTKTPKGKNNIKLANRFSEEIALQSSTAELVVKRYSVIDLNGIRLILAFMFSRLNQK